MFPTPSQALSDSGSREHKNTKLRDGLVVVFSAVSDRVRNEKLRIGCGMLEGQHNQLLRQLIEVMAAKLTALAVSLFDITLCGLTPMLSMHSSVILTCDMSHV